MPVTAVERYSPTNTIETSTWSIRDALTRETENIPVISATVRLKNEIDYGFIFCTCMRSTVHINARNVANVSRNLPAWTNTWESTVENDRINVRIAPKHLQLRRSCARIYVSIVEKNLLNVAIVEKHLPLMLHMIVTCGARILRKNRASASIVEKPLRSHTSSSFTWTCTLETNLTLVNDVVVDFQAHRPEIDIDQTLTVQHGKIARRRLWSAVLILQGNATIQHSCEFWWWLQSWPNVFGTACYNKTFLAKSSTKGKCVLKHFRCPLPSPMQCWAEHMYWILNFFQH